TPPQRPGGARGRAVDMPDLRYRHPARGQLLPELRHLAAHRRVGRERPGRRRAGSGRAVSSAPPTTRCPYCRAEVPDDARYCLECGEGIRPYQLLDPKGRTVRVAADGTTIVERRGPPGGLVWPILLLAVVLGALAAYALTRNDDEQNA